LEKINAIDIKGTDSILESDREEARGGGSSRKYLIKKD
jgi:hypothetical protein